MVAPQLVIELKDQEHQARVLAEAGSLTSLHEKFSRLQCFEATEESAKLSVLDPKSDAAAMKSAYKKEKVPQVSFFIIKIFFWNY